MTEQKKLSLCIITKDDEPHLTDCLKSMAGTADEIIVASLGSSRQIPALAERANITVCQPDWEDDFSKIKNFCMDRATGDWVLFLQADETIPHDQLDELRLLMLNPAAEGYLLDVDDSREKQAEVCPAQSLRLLRNRKNYRFRYRSYAYIPDEELYSILSGSISIVRGGEAAAGWQEKERKRLLKADLKEHPQDGYLRYLLGIELLNEGKYKEAAASFELARHTLCGGYLYAPHLYKCLGVCLAALSRHEAAQEVINEGIWLFPFFTDLLVLRAQIYHQLGRDTEALKTLEVCMTLRNAPDACLVEPKIDTNAMKKMWEEIRARQENVTMKV